MLVRFQRCYLNSLRRPLNLSLLERIYNCVLNPNTPVNECFTIIEDEILATEVTVTIQFLRTKTLWNDEFYSLVNKLS